MYLVLCYWAIGKSSRGQVLPFWNFFITRRILLPWHLEIISVIYSVCFCFPVLYIFNLLSPSPPDLPLIPWNTSLSRHSLNLRKIMSREAMYVLQLHYYFSSNPFLFVYECNSKKDNDWIHGFYLLISICLVCTVHLKSLVIKTHFTFNCLVKHYKWICFWCLHASCGI